MLLLTLILQRGTLRDAWNLQARHAEKHRFGKSKIEQQTSAFQRKSRESREE